MAERMREARDTMKDMFFIFEIDKEDYGVEVAFVKEIISMQNITRVPKMPHFIEGITNLRGDLIGVLDVRKRFGKEPKEYDEETCIVVIEFNKYTLGLIVDGVKAAQTIEAENVSPPPNAKLNSYNQFIRNIGKVGNSVKLLLDLERFLEQ
ncbi:MAG: chemotaxis protein CheW [Defluviitaleaceae bacterium]|nr:chemotaxis protein CheW [Defluviitaleaceae bacterium]